MESTQAKYPLPDILTVKDLAEYFNCHISTIYRMVKERRLPVFRVRSDFRFRRDEIEKWMADGIERR